MKHLNNTAGFTIVEVVVALTVTTFMIGVVGNFILNNIRETSLANVRQDMLHETQLTLDRVADDVRLAANADTNNRWPDGNSPGGLLNMYGWQSSNNILVLATASQDRSSIIQFLDAKNYVTQKDNIVYFVNGNVLYRRTLAAPFTNNGITTSCPANRVTAVCPADKKLLQNITNFSITYLDGLNQSVSPTDARSIEMRVRTSKQVYSRTITSDYTTRMVFRNE